MSKIPYEIIADIFHQLPVKTLLRFRCLSTPLCSLIDGPDFINLHLTHSIKTKSQLSIILKDWSLYTVDFDSLDAAVELNNHPLYTGGGTEVVGSCNGIVALRNSERNLALYNISTRNLKKLVVSEIDPPPSGDCLKTGYVFYGFGYDSLNDDYKLLRMAQFVKDDDDVANDFLYWGYEVKVYSLKSDSWKKIKDLPYCLRFLHKPFYQVLHRRGYGVFAGRSLHWVFPQRPELGVKNSIFAFDIGAEKFHQVPQPDYGRKDLTFKVDVGVLEGSLCVMCNFAHEFVDVWVMKEYGVRESWTKLFSVQITKAISAFMFVRPLAYSKEGDKVLLEVNDHKLVWYDWNQKSVRSVKIQGCPKYFGAEMYVGSLVPLDDGSATEEKRKKQEQEVKEKINTNRKKRDDFLSVGFKLKL